MLRMAVVFLVCFTANTGFGGGSQKPEDLGAYRAQVSDQAELEMLVDLLKGVAAGERSEEVVRNRAPFISASALSGGQAASGPLSIEITGEADHASAVMPGGGALQFEKRSGRWILVAVGSPLGTSVTATARGGTEGFSAGATFLQTPLSGDLGIGTLTRSTARSLLGRTLMSSGGPTASWYSLRYTSSAPFVHATYIQFLVDREWNRVLFGNMYHWVKSYDNVAGPAAVTTDPGGHVYLSETGSQKVTVLAITGEGASADLVPLYSLDNITEPADLAFNDGGTPFDRSDDLLYVIDAGNGSILRFAVSETGAIPSGSFGEFEDPSVICSGTWNGSNNSLLYVVDQGGKRLRLFDDRAGSLVHIAEVKASPREYFQDVATDHFGNIYVTEPVNGMVHKYTSDLRLLDSEGGSGGAYQAPGYAHIPFGSIEIEGEGRFRAGFDQMFALERWGEETGIQRRTLGLALKEIRFLPDQDIRQIHAAFILTDFGNIGVTVYDEAGKIVRNLHSAWMTSGRKSVSWDRRDGSGAQVPPGVYRIEIEGGSPYRDEAVRSESQFYLPLYYWQDAGGGSPSDDAMLAQGSAVSWGITPSETANEHASSVQYRFTGINPESEYMIAAEYVSGDGISRMQDLTVGGVPLHAPVPVNGSTYHTGYLAVPKEAFESGELLLSVNRGGEGTAIVSQLWLKETGSVFSPHEADGTLPRSYTLDQNYPNPFNPSTVIRYSLPVDGRITLKVFDITGREVTTLVNEQKQAGTYEVQFDAAGLASGVYFYRVQSGRFSEAKKMVLLK